MIKWLKREKIASIHLCAGDSIVLKYQDWKGDQHETVRSEIGKTMTVNEVGVFTFEDEFDMEEGVGGVFGKSKE